MASKKLIPKSDLRHIAATKVGDRVFTRFGEATVTQLAKNRARYALQHFDDNDNK